MEVLALTQLAIVWAARGFRVFPVAIGWDQEKGHTSKRPLTIHGHADATSNISTLHKLIARPPLQLQKGEELGIGMLPGDYIILDADRHKYDGVLFADSLGATSPYVVDTAGNGEHRFFRKPAGMTFSNRIPHTWNGLMDVRADAGWIVAPGVVTSWGSWDPRAPWDSVKIPVLPDDITKALQEVNQDSGGFAPWARYVPEKHDPHLDPATVEAFKILVEKHGAEVRKTYLARRDVHDHILGTDESHYYLKLCRPGKTTGVSATLGYNSPGAFHVFTSNWPPFEINKVYDMESGSSGTDPRTKRTERAGRVKLIDADSIRLEHVSWCWEDRMAAGMLSLLAGREGLGKSMIGYWIAAQLTQGKLPGIHFGTPKHVFIVATEDSWPHVVAPRLIAAGADMSYIKQVKADLGEGVEGEIILPQDVVELTLVAMDLQPALLLLDPFMSRVAGGLDSHKDADVRRALEPLTSMLFNTGMAALGIMHFNKAGGTDPLNAIMASKAFTAVARTVNVVLPHPVTEGDGLFGTAKSNLGASVTLPRLGYHVEATFVEQNGETFKTGVLRWTDNYHGSIEDAMEAAQNGGERGPGSEAREFLRDYLTENAGPQGWVPRKEVMAAAKREEIGKDAVERARLALNVQRRRTRTMPTTSEWRLPGFDALDGLVQDA